MKDNSKVTPGGFCLSEHLKRRDPLNAEHFKDPPDYVPSGAPGR